MFARIPPGAVGWRWFRPKAQRLAQMTARLGWRTGECGPIPRGRYGNRVPLSFPFPMKPSRLPAAYRRWHVVPVQVSRQVRLALRAPSAIGGHKFLRRYSPARQALGQGWYRQPQRLPFTLGHSRCGVVAIFARFFLPRLLVSAATANGHPEVLGRATP